MGLAESNAIVLLGQAPHDPGHARDGGIDLAEVPNLATALAIGDRDRIPSLGNVNPDENLAMLVLLC